MTSLLTFPTTCPSMMFGSRKKKKRHAAATNTTVAPSRVNADPQDTVSFNKQETERIRKEQQQKTEVELEAQKQQEQAAWQTHATETPSGGSGNIVLTEDQIAQKKLKKKQQREAYKLRKAAKEEAQQAEDAKKEEERRARLLNAFALPPVVVSQEERRRVEAELTKTETDIKTDNRNDLDNKLRDGIAALRPDRVSFIDEIDQHRTLRHLGSKPNLYLNLVVQSDVDFPTLKRVFEEHCQSNVNKLGREYRDKGEQLFKIFDSLSAV